MPRFKFPSPDRLRLHGRPPHGSGACRFAATLLWLLLASGPGRAQDRFELRNLSAKPWTLALVEGANPGVGTLECLDKFTGRTLAALDHTGSSTVLPPHSRILLVFQRKDGYLYRSFILRDHLGNYGEYQASLEFLTSRRITLEQVSQRVGERLSQLDGDSLQQFMDSAIDLEADSITLRTNALERLEPEERDDALRPPGRH